MSFSLTTDTLKVTFSALQKILRVQCVIQIKICICLNVQIYLSIYRPIIFIKPLLSSFLKVQYFFGACYNQPSRKHKINRVR